MTKEELKNLRKKGKIAVAKWRQKEGEGANVEANTEATCYR